MRALNSVEFCDGLAEDFARDVDALSQVAEVICMQEVSANWGAFARDVLQPSWGVRWLDSKLFLWKMPVVEFSGIWWDRLYTEEHASETRKFRGVAWVAHGA